MDFHVLIEGNIVKHDPEMFSTRKGLTGTRFEIAHRPSYRGADGKWVEAKSQYYTVVCWGKLADRVLDSFQEGDTVTVSAKSIGALTSNGFTDITLTAANVAGSVRFRNVTPERKTRSATEVIRTADGETLPVYDAPEAIDHAERFAEPAAA
jgi:single-stranded DNA-binding protein